MGDGEWPQNKVQLGPVPQGTGLPWTTVAGLQLGIVPCLNVELLQSISAVTERKEWEQQSCWGQSTANQANLPVGAAPGQNGTTIGQPAGPSLTRDCATVDGATGSGSSSANADELDGPLTQAVHSGHWDGMLTAQKVFTMSAVCDSQQAISSTKNQTAKDSSAVGPPVGIGFTADMVTPLAVVGSPLGTGLTTETFTPPDQACHDSCPSCMSGHGCYGNANGEPWLRLAQCSWVTWFKCKQHSQVPHMEHGRVTVRGARSKQLHPLQLNWRLDSQLPQQWQLQTLLLQWLFFRIYDGAFSIHKSGIISTDRKHGVALYIQLCASWNGTINFGTDSQWMAPVASAGVPGQQAQDTINMALAMWNMMEHDDMFQQ